ncbi:hypothetical protein PICST_37559 [Scheffersomyces stipitis CBS 6054]|uniref:Clavaminate synthase-like protein n=1 Tax=Scheffersomyces stipitis (strain ATCC 58785 / CBS 6054 / NBRC 10063 / NRRL Y-11545) TaxID=322104 RepID=A3GGZ5_PICST|nr:predicted protein [Scheffersomyces stipitis CBS 6054]EAZ64007.2 hypothetical protein PICST_37559 [Scheffersomyces stipitis CBS 6054]KAG2735786.1 hypothetical protein G9P44_002000 [Scheffersomyces stipitis]
MTNAAVRTPVVVSLKELVQGIDHATLAEAFGPQSLGIIVIKDLPQKFHDLRLKVLKSISILANLGPDVLSNLESEEAMWLTGWSCGKEILANSGKPDFNKGSYYVNCAFHKNPEWEGPTEKLTKEFINHRAYTTANMWPSADHKGLENFQEDAKELISLIIDVAQSVAANCDKFITESKISPNYEQNYLERIVKNSTCTKARLLHYFPSKSSSESGKDDDWCGEHLDHSCLTGLTSALFIDESKGLTAALDKSPDPESGLYIRDRQNEVVKVNIPPECLAFQTGSTLQEVSRGKFSAVPHYVKGTSIPNIARNTLAVFCQPDLDEMVNDSENFAQYADRILKANH